MRRSNHAIKAARRATCECGALRQPHRACPECGKYNGRVVVDVVARTSRDQRRAKRKDAELQQSGRSTTKTARDEAAAK